MIGQKCALNVTVILHFVRSVECDAAAPIKWLISLPPPECGVPRRAADGHIAFTFQTVPFLNDRKCDRMAA
jgi:hypothetical protein